MPAPKFFKTKFDALAINCAIGHSNGEPAYTNPASNLRSAGTPGLRAYSKYNAGYSDLSARYAGNLFFFQTGQAPSILLD